MARILIAWELGANYGHLTRLAPIAERLRAVGHQVVLAVRDAKTAAELLEGRELAFVQAPIQARRPRAQREGPASYAEMLALEGYADGTTLRGMVHAWTSLMQLYRAEALVADHSPGSILAARLLGLPSCCVGTGFEIPPRTAPLPCIRPWENIPTDRLARSEEKILQIVNGVLRDLGGMELERLSHIFDVQGRLFLTFSEIDPYGPRPNERYLGPAYDAQLGEACAWPRDDGRPRIYAYLRAGVPGVVDILRALKRVEATALCVVPGIPPQVSGGLASDRLRISARPLQLRPILPAADLVLSYAGHGMLGAALVAGVPQCLAPQNVEQFLHAKRVEALGAGVVLGRERSTETVAALLERMLADAAPKAAARVFAERHAGFDPARLTEEAAGIIDDVVCGRSRAAGGPTEPDRVRPSSKPARREQATAKSPDR